MTSALLALADGSVFRGRAVGALGETVGEVVFNTSMTGYQEILTDPSYARQLVTLTSPHVGNTGCNAVDVESDRIQAAGVIVRDVPRLASNWRSKESLSDYLRRQHIVAITDVDTRRLTRLLRHKGALNGCIMAGEHVNAEDALAKAGAFGGLEGADLAREVCTGRARDFDEGSWSLTTGHFTHPEPKWKVVAYDFGVKRRILQLLVDRGCAVHLVPATTPAEDVLAMKPDGIFLSNGPGDPAASNYAIKATGKLLESHLPLFGICLGQQLMALAMGAKTIKMKFGHHGANHPVRDLDDGRVLITSQNHGFAVDPDSLPDNIRQTHHSLFDGTLQGFALTDRPAFCFQGHPEASPGPHDIIYLFDRFVRLMEEASHA